MRTCDHAEDNPRHVVLFFSRLKERPEDNSPYRTETNRIKETSMHTNATTALVFCVATLGIMSVCVPRFVNAQETRDYYANSDYPDNALIANNASWMLRIDDNTKLTQMSIPGTHDSGARFGGIAFECQVWKLSDQLKAGIRYLDIRCRRLKQGDFAIHHGKKFMKKMFGHRERAGNTRLEPPVLSDVRKFLQAHPSECVIMRVKSEYDAEEGAPPMKDEFERIIARPENRNLFYTGTTIPRLGDVRGKVILLDNAGLGQGIPYGGTLCSIQDLYKVYALLNDQPEADRKASLPQKKRRVKEEIEAANKQSSKLYINHCSGSVGLAPYSVAKQVNSEIHEYLGGKAVPTIAGILVFDFPGEALISRVIALNKLQHTH